MSIEEMIMNGATPEEINAAMQAVYLEKEREDKVRAKKEQETMLRKLAEQEQAEARAEEEARVEMLKREARAYIINGMLAYCEAFNLLDGEEPDKHDIEALEACLIQIEGYLPLAKEIAKLQAEQQEKFGEGFDLGMFGGLFGGIQHRNKRRLILRVGRLSIFLQYFQNFPTAMIYYPQSMLVCFLLTIAQLLSSSLLSSFIHFLTIL